MLFICSTSYKKYSFVCRAADTLIYFRHMENGDSIPFGDSLVPIVSGVRGKLLGIEKGGADREIWHPDLVYAFHGQKGDTVQAFFVVALGSPSEENLPQKAK